MSGYSNNPAHPLALALQKGLAGGPNPDSLQLSLQALGVNDARVWTAIREQDEIGAEAAFSRAVTFEMKAEDMFVEKSLHPWCARHGLSVHQAISILLNDGTFNPENPEKDLVDYRSMFNWGSQLSGFLLRLSRIDTANFQKAVTPVSPPTQSALPKELYDSIEELSDATRALVGRTESLLHGPYDDDPAQAVRQMLAKLPPSAAADALHRYIQQQEEPGNRGDVPRG